MRKIRVSCLAFAFVGVSVSGVAQAAPTNICGPGCDYYAHHCFCGDDGTTPETVVSCTHVGQVETIDVEIQTGSEDAVFRATVSEKSKFTEIPDEPPTEIATYDPVYRNQHMDYYHSADGKFSLQLGDSMTAHVRYGDVEMDLDSCTRANQD